MADCTHAFCLPYGRGCLFDSVAHTDAHGNLIDTCGHCQFLPTTGEPVRAVQVGCPVHSEHPDARRVRTQVERAADDHAWRRDLIGVRTADGRLHAPEDVQLVYPADRPDPDMDDHREHPPASPPLVAPTHPEEPVTRPSIRATYDSEKTGPRYHATATIDGKVVGEFRQPLPDPFVRTTVRVGWRDLLRALPRRRLVVEVTVGADPELMNDVLELDDQTLIHGRTRQAAWQQSMHQKLRSFAESTTEEPA